jgi:hypothetical protein
MKKKSNPAPQRAPVTPERASFKARREDVPWFAALVTLLFVLIACTWYPLDKVTAQYEMGPNEGFNSYFQQTAADGGKVYGKEPQFYYANYPPLSFHLIGLAGAIAGGVNLAGRWISVLSYLLIGLFAALTVERLTGVRRYGWYAGLCWLIWLAAFDPNRIGFNDPHLLGIAFSVAGFYCYVRDPGSVKWLRWSAVLFALSVFTKQTLVAFPAAVAIETFLSARQQLWTWLVTVVGTCVMLLGLTLVIDGSYFFRHLMLPRVWSMAGVTGSTTTYLSFIGIAFLAAVVWIFRMRSTGPVRALAIAFAAAFVFGAFAVAGDGAGINHYFESMVATAMIVGVALTQVEAIANASPYPRAALTALLVVPFFLTTLMKLPERAPLDIARNSLGKPALETEFLHAVQFVRAQPGPVLCENLLICFDAGKPETVDAFALDQAIKTGHLQEESILRLVASRSFGAIQLEITQGETVRPVARHRFTTAFMKQLLVSYRLAARSSRHAFYVPVQGG